MRFNPDDDSTQYRRNVRDDARSHDEVGAPGAPLRLN